MAGGEDWAAAERMAGLICRGVQNTVVFSALPLRGAIRTDMSPVWTWPQSGIIEKSGGYFCVGARQNANECLLVTTSCGRRARYRLKFWGLTECDGGGNVRR